MLKHNCLSNLPFCERATSEQQHHLGTLIQMLLGAKVTFLQRDNLTNNLLTLITQCALIQKT